MKYITLILLSLIFYSSAFTQEDIKGSKDHPLFNRMPGYRIARYEENEFDVLKEFKDENRKKMNVEGHYYYFNYLVKKGSEAASGPQVLRNYMNAVKNAGGTVVLEDGCCNVYLKLNKDNRITWVWVKAYKDAGSYQVWIVEEENMEQDIVVNANSMMSGINSEGRIALYGIYFDFDKSEVKSESNPTLQEIAKLLTENKNLKLYVVGHTDNVGDLSYNMKLSESRADAVVKNLVSNYKIDKSRLTPAGVGPLCPVTSNDTEEGKAKNRRVELVQK